MNVRVPMTVEVCRSSLQKAVHESAKLALALLCLVSGFAVTANAQTSLPATLRAADFDQGANGVSYRDTTSGNSGGYYRATDVDIEGCAEGGVSVGWASGGEWLNYTVNVPEAGTYSLDLRVASEGGGRMNVQFGGSNKTGSMSVPATGGWQSWTTISTTVNLSAGVQVMRVNFESDGINLSSIGVGGGGGGGSNASPSSGGRTFPGTVEAENFDDGGSGGAYWDSSSGNSGGEYRDTDVDIEASSEGAYNIGWAAAGEWVNYTTNVQSAGTYTLNLRVASTRGGWIYVLFDGTNKTGTLRVPVTGGYQSWTTVSATVNLSAGTQVMRVVFESDGVNLNSISATSGGGSAPPTPTTPTVSAPFGGSAAAIPGTIQAEGFDSGGAGIAYNDHTSGNAGGAYRATDVDVEAGASGHAVGWTGAGEWLQYTVNVGAAGNYVMTVRVASAGSGGSFHVEANGRNLAAMGIPDTGWWSNYHDIATTVYLDAGVQQMRVFFDSNASSGAAGNIDFVTFAPATAAPTPTPPTSSGGGRLRVMTWNINFGSDPWGQAQVIADSGADVALLQEASLWDEDMRVTYPERLQQLTGQKWYSVFASHSGRYSPNEGTMILSRLPLLDQSTRNAYDRGFSRILVSVGGVQVNLFNAHLDWYDTNMRTLQEQDLMWWAAELGGRRILGGDFNSWWDEYWIRLITGEYSDTWVEVTGSQENGYTLNGSVRFDYLFHNTGVSPTDAWVTSTSRSDHAPLIADYSIR